MGTDQTQAPTDELKSGIRLLNSRLEEISQKLEAQRLELSQIQADRKVRDRLDDFRGKEFEPLRSKVSDISSTLKWMRAAGLLIVAVAGFVGWNSVKDIEAGIKAGIKAQSEPLMNYTFNLSAGMDLDERDPQDAIWYLEEAFKNSPDAETQKHGDAVLIASIFHAMDNAGSYQDAVTYLRSLQKDSRYQAHVDGDGHLEVGIALLGRAIETRDLNMLDESISNLNTAINHLPSGDNDVWYSNLNLWVCYMVRAEIDKSSSAQDLRQADECLVKMFSLPTPPDFGPWKDWDELNAKTWFPKLLQEMPGVADRAKNLFERQQKANPNRGESASG